MISILDFTLFFLAVIGIGVGGVCWAETRDRGYAKSQDALGDGGRWWR